MFQWLRSLFGGRRSRKLREPAAAGRGRVIRARYDSAQTNDDNAKLWANTDALSPTAAHNPEVRKRLRERARYEVANNSYAKGIITTLAYNLIGPGPTLQIQTDDAELNNRVQKAFAEWMRATRLPDQLRTMVQSKKVDGESFGIAMTNPALPTAVRLDLLLVEADQVTSPDVAAYMNPNAVDGIIFDGSGNPASYDVLHHHPGDTFRGFTHGYERLPARRVLHWYRADRPGQARGVPELTPALSLFAKLRRFTDATLTAAETAAMFAALIKSNVAPDDETDEITAFDQQELDKGMMTFLPTGYEMQQLRAEHPGTTYEMFVRLLLREIARCLNVPWNLAAGDSSAYNYSSARLDHLNYWLAVGVERQDLEQEVLDPLFMLWLEEAVLIPGLLPQAIRAHLTHLPHTWHWPARPFIDPVVEAQADSERLRNGTDTLASICAARGTDWQEVIRQRVREQQFAAAEAAKVGVAAPVLYAEVTPPLTIAAAGKPASLRIGGAAPVHLQAAEGELKLRRFDMVAYTGGPMMLEGFDRPVIVDLAGITVPSKTRPILRDHLQWKIVGHTDDIRVSPGDLAVAGVISGTGPHVDEVVALSDNGFPWQASIGASAEVVEFIDAGRTVEVNNQTFTGPVYVARKTTLREISFVANGADGNTVASLAASGGYAMTFEEFVASLGLTMDKLDEQQMAVMKAYHAKLFPEAVAAATPPDAAASQQAAGASAPAAAAAPAPAVAAGAVRPAIQGTAPADIVAQSRRDMAAEINRQNGIRRICAGNPDRTIEVNEGGQRRTVNLQAHAVAAGWTEQDVELHVLRTDRQTGTPFGYVRSGTPAVTSATIEAAICKTARLPNIEKHFTEQVLDAADRQFRAIGLQQVMLMAAAQNGYQVGAGMRINPGNLRSVLRAALPQNIEAGFTPISLPGIFSNVANKEILEGYAEEDQTWREVAGIRTVTDFKQISSYRLLDSFEYEEVGPGGEIKHGKLDEESYTRQAKTYAKMLCLTREAIINDDMGAFDTIRVRLGRGAGMKLKVVFWTKWLATIASHWTTARLNYIEGATTNLGTDGVGLGLGVKAFRTMKTPTADGGKRIGGTPELLVVPPELESIADVLYTARNNNAVKASDVNTHVGKYRPVVVPELSDSTYTGYSTTAWWLLRSPSIAPAAVVSFLNGVETPTIEDAEADFDVLGVQFRGFHDFGVDMAEYLAGVRSKGAA